MSTLVIVMLGELTFAFLGIDVPYITTKMISSSVIAVIFGLLERHSVLALVSGHAWRSGKAIDSVVFHPDERGRAIAM